MASLYDLEHLLVYGAWLSVIGSMLFLAGATLNVIDVANAPQGRIMQLTNLTAVAFVVGAVLFTVGSFPDFWHEAVHNDREEMLTYVAWLSVWGSAVFLLGGLINYRRALLVQEMRGGA